MHSSFSSKPLSAEVRTEFIEKELRAARYYLVPQIWEWEKKTKVYEAEVLLLLLLGLVDFGFFFIEISQYQEQLEWLSCWDEDLTLHMDCSSRSHGGTI